ncbi:LOW QUALITY PROTEIN: uncharacterized protein ACOB6Z_012655 [Ctenodactylus gundi]
MGQSGRSRHQKRARAQAQLRNLEAYAAQPHSFVFARGRAGRSVRQLSLDVRRVLEPLTASRLQVRKKNSLKDCVAVAGPLGVTHFLILSRTETSVYLKLMRLPGGPTLTFRVNKYTLVRDVISSLRRHRMHEQQFAHPPLLVLSSFGPYGMHVKLMATMFQNLLPSLNVHKVNLNTIKRCLLISYDPDSQELDFRHYSIKVVPVGASRGMKKLLQEKFPNMSRLQDISELLATGVGLSESEAEPDGEHNITELPQAVAGRGNMRAQQSAVRLTEIGPRMTLQLIKIQEGIGEGNVLFHGFVHKTEEELRSILAAKEERLRLKAQRQDQQAQNVQRKREQREAHKKRSLAGMKRAQAGASGDSDAEDPGVPPEAEGPRQPLEEEEDEVEYFRQAVGEEPDEDMFPQAAKPRRRAGPPGKKRRLKESGPAGQSGGSRPPKIPGRPRRAHARNGLGRVLHSRGEQAARLCSGAVSKEGECHRHEEGSGALRLRPGGAAGAGAGDREVPSWLGTSGLAVCRAGGRPEAGRVSMAPAAGAGAVGEDGPLLPRGCGAHAPSVQGCRDAEKRVVAVSRHQPAPGKGTGRTGRDVSSPRSGAGAVLHVGLWTGHRPESSARAAGEWREETSTIGLTGALCWPQRQSALGERSTIVQPGRSWSRGRVSLVMAERTTGIASQGPTHGVVPAPAAGVGPEGSGSCTSTEGPQQHRVSAGAQACPANFSATADRVLGSYQEAFLWPVLVAEFLVAVAGNGLVLCRFSRREPCPWNPAVVFSAQLAVSNLLYTVTPPLAAYLYPPKNWRYGELACRLERFLSTCNLLGGVVFLPCISLHRYLGVTHPFFTHSRLRPRHAWVGRAVGWVLAAPHYFPTCPNPRRPVAGAVWLEPCARGSSSHQLAAYKAYSVALAGPGGGVPLLLTLVAYGALVRAMWHSPGLRVAEKWRVAVLVTCGVSVLYASSYVPYHVTRVLNVDARQRWLARWPDFADEAEAVQALELGAYLGYQAMCGLVALPICIHPLLYTAVVPSLGCCVGGRAPKSRDPGQALSFRVPAASPAEPSP